MRVLVALVLAGCVQRVQTTRIVVRDPAQIAVTGVLPVDAARGDVPDSDGSWVERAEGVIVGWCPHCRVWKRRDLFANTEIVVPGRPAESLAFDADTVRMHYVYNDARYIRGRWGVAAFPEKRFTLDLATPRTNVVSIEGLDRVIHSGGGHDGISQLVFGVAWGVLGAALATFGEIKHTPLVVGFGVGMVAIGGGGIVWGVREYRAHDEITPISP